MKTEMGSCAFFDEFNVKHMGVLKKYWAYTVILQKNATDWGLNMFILNMS